MTVHPVRAVAIGAALLGVSTLSFAIGNATVTPNGPRWVRVASVLNGATICVIAMLLSALP